MTRDQLESIIWLSAPYLPRSMVETIMAAADRYAMHEVVAEVSLAAHRRNVLEAEVDAIERRGRPRSVAA